MNANKIFDKLRMHYKCRNSVYPRNPRIIRYNVPDNKISWDVPWIEYNPVLYNSESIRNQPWADPPIEDPSFLPKWNDLDGNVNRKSYIKSYEIIKGLPLNPIGRTGITGRGCLGRWGPNHAADPILTRWKRNSNKDIIYNEITEKPILQFVAIQRRDCKEWAIPGGMVDPGEAVSCALKREFLEEALSTCIGNENEEKKKLVEELFKSGTEIYKGYVDDPRNTDNAWMETVATNFHHEDGKYVDQLNLKAGDDAVNVKWVDLNSQINLYASHIDFLAKVAEIRDCHW